MWHFLLPKPDGSVFHIVLGGKDTAAAFEEFAREYWHEGLTGSIGVWMNHCLCARVTTIVNNDTGEVRPYLQEWP